MNHLWRKKEKIQKSHLHNMAGQVGGETVPLIAGSMKKKKTIMRQVTSHPDKADKQKQRKVNNANH
jgi:hypothetical protein